MGMTRFYTAILIFIFGFSFAQELPELDQQKMDELREVIYYHDNGQMSQKGTFNAEGKLHGVWTSYDINGNKTMVGIYKNNRKVGKWLIWNDGTLREIEYSNSKVVSVSEWQDKVQLAVSNR